MADPSSPIEVEEVPLDEGRRMGRGLRIEPMLYNTLRQKIQSLSSEAVRIHLGPQISPVRMKRYIQAIARELNVPLTIRRVPGGVIFRRSSKEDLQQAKDVGARLQTDQRRQKARPTGRRPRETR